MKIFLSYGHDQNTPLVERIRADLETAGHAVWIDNAKIKSGDDWRRSIVDGLFDTDWTLAFLSNHSTRDPGVCLDELAIALHVKGGTIATVLVEAADSVRPPVSLSHIQWLDMHDWMSRRNAGGPTWDAWYRSKLDEILALLADPATQRFAGEIAELERRLRPFSHEADIGALVDGFVGREWLRARVDDWRKNAKGSRLFWISGAPGSGKSAFAAWLAHRGSVNVIGLNLCRYNIDERRDPAQVLRTLTFQIATRLPDYRRLLLDRLVKQDPDATELPRKSPAALFDWLLAEPLGFAIEGGRREDRFLVVIDALDETIRDGRSELAEVLADWGRKLPAWMAVVVTSRPESPIVRQLAGVPPQIIAAESDNNLDDLRAYARGWLETEGRASDDRDALIGRIVSASGGNFLYLRKLREAVEAGLLTLDVPEGLPQGLVGLYERWFRRQFPDAAKYEEFLPLLAVLVAAEHPVPEEWLAHIFGWSMRERARMMEGLGSLFERRAKGVAPFHKSLRDWLVDERTAGSAFVVDSAEGTRRIADALWAAFMRRVKESDSNPLDPFCVAELPVQIAQLPEVAIRAQLSAAGSWSDVWSALARQATSLRDTFEWSTALAWWRMAALLAELCGSDARADHAAALLSVGDVLLTLGRSEDALKCYRDSLAISDRLAKADPNNAGRQYAFSVSHNKVGDVLMARGDRAGALAAYRAAMIIRETLAVQDPANAVWQRALSVSHERIGDMLATQGDRFAALAAYRASMNITQRLATEHPGNTDWQVLLSVSYAKIGDILMAQGDLAGALTAYRARMTILLRLVEQDPDNLNVRHLFLGWSKIGDALRAQFNWADALRAYRACVGIAERVVEKDPSNAEWSSFLASSHERMGIILESQGDHRGAISAYRVGITVRERLAAQDPGNASWQRDLSNGYINTGDALKKLGNPEGALAAYRAGTAIMERLTAQDPDNAEWQSLLSTAHDSTGMLLDAEGDRTGALVAYRTSVAIAERLTAQKPASGEWLFGLVVSHLRLTEALLSTGDPMARSHALQVMAQARSWADRFPQDPRRRILLEAVEGLVERSGRH